MSSYGKPTPIEIASLKKHEVSYNVMMPGSGTPWEDRGAIGLISAFLKTCFRSLFSHKTLVDQIRRPETTAEATRFAAGCAVPWAISVGIWDAYQYHIVANDPTLVVDGQQFAIESALRVVGAFVLTIGILKLAGTVFYSLLSNDSQRKIPKVLVYNVLAYSLGPSILAIIPVFGWVLAALWIIIDAMVGTKLRLYLRAREAVVNVILATVVSLVLLTLVYFLCYFVWPIPFGHSVSKFELPPKAPTT